MSIIDKAKDLIKEIIADIAGEKENTETPEGAHAKPDDSE